MNVKIKTLAAKEEIKQLARMPELTADQDKTFKTILYDFVILVTLPMMEHNFTWYFNHFFVL